MQYFYIVGYTLIGNDLTLCKVSLNEHALVSWARREAIKYDFRTYELYKQPITRTGKITFVRQIKPSKKPIDIQTSVVPFDWGEFEESQQNLACEEHSSHHNWTVIPPDEKDERPVYQVTPLEAGPNREDLIKFIANARMIEPSYAEALVDHMPSVIQKKYKLTKETMCFDGVTLHRIQALKDFGNVEAGELGGWVESEKNLSQSGDCWIAMEAKAYGGAEIGDSAILTRKAIACGNSTICNDTLVSDESIIRGFTYLYGNVEVYGKSVIDGDASLHGNVKVIGAKVIDAEVYDRVIICDGAYVHGRIKIDGTAYISNGAEVCKTDDYIVFKNFWSSGRHFTWTRSNNKWHVGCFSGTGEELIKKAYQDSEKSGREYERVVRYVESILADEQKEQEK